LHSCNYTCFCFTLMACSSCMRDSCRIAHSSPILRNFLAIEGGLYLSVWYKHHIGIVNIESKIMNYDLLLGPSSNTILRLFLNAVCKPAGSIVIISIIFGTVAFMFLLLSVSKWFLFYNILCPWSVVIVSYVTLALLQC
jgi:hypothetical protein